MLFPKGFTDEVRNSADIVRVVSDYVALKKRGANHIACCPFHSEKTPSFNVHPGKQVFKCFGCGVAGDVFRFIMEMERCSFPEALKTVADKCGIPLPQVQVNDDYKQAARERDDLLQINEWAAQFFTSQLGEGPEGRNALEYVNQRGIQTETYTLLRMGYAPNSWDGLANELKRRGASASQIERSGLVSLRDSGIGHYDRFRGRLIFPITDPQGRIIAFGGRILGPGEPKYLNSPETPLYSKSRNLFGLSFAKDEIRRRDAAVLVEGYLDFTIPFQAGIRNVIASLGTALTDQQVKLLGRYTRRIVVNYDPDSAGINATKRSIELLINEGFKVNVMTLPDGQDPDEYVLRHGESAYRGLLRSSKPCIEYIIEQAIKEHDVARPAGKAEAVKAGAPYIAKIKDKIEKAEYIDQAAHRLKVDVKVMRDAVRQAEAGQTLKVEAATFLAPLDLTPAERSLLGLLTNSDAVRLAVLPLLQPEDFAGLRSASLFGATLWLSGAGQSLNFGNFTSRLADLGVEDEDLMGNVLPQVLIEGADIVESRAEDEVVTNARECLKTMRRDLLKREIAGLSLEIEDLGRNGDHNRVIELSQRKLKLSQRLQEEF